MNSRIIIRLMEFSAASVLSLVAFLLPYRARVLYLSGVGFVVHLPYFMFGKIAHYLVKKLDIRFEGGA